MTGTHKRSKCGCIDTQEMLHFKSKNERIRGKKERETTKHSRLPKKWAELF